MQIPVSGLHNNIVYFFKNGILNNRQMCQRIYLFSRFVVSSHIRHHPTQRGTVLEDINGVDPEFTLSQDLLKKYIVYSRENLHPKLQVGYTVYHEDWKLSKSPVYSGSIFLMPLDKLHVSAVVSIQLISIQLPFGLGSILLYYFLSDNNDRSPYRRSVCKK